MDRIRDIARRVSNWGRWGADDERGTINFVTPDVIRRAAACVRRGDGLQPGAAARRRRPAVRTGRPREPRAPDDVAAEPARARSRRPALLRRRDRDAAPVRDAVGQPGARALRRAALQRAPRVDADAGRRVAQRHRQDAGGHRVARRPARRRARARRRAPATRAGDRPRRARGRRARAGRARRVGRRAADPHRPHPRVHGGSRSRGVHEADARPRHRQRRVAARARGRGRGERHQHGGGVPAGRPGGDAAAARALHPRHGAHAGRDVRPGGARRGLRAATACGTSCSRRRR